MTLRQRESLLTEGYNGSVLSTAQTEAYFLVMTLPKASNNCLILVSNFTLDKTQGTVVVATIFNSVNHLTYIFYVTFHRKQSNDSSLMLL